MGIKLPILALQACLIGLVFFVLARAVILFVTPESAWIMEGEQRRSYAAPMATIKSYDFAFDPFHRDISKPAAPLGENAPETSLNLKLFGLRSGRLQDEMTDGAEADRGGSAILQTPDKVQGVYKVGEEILPDVVLKSVNPNYIVISQDGRLERLTFEDKNPSLIIEAPPPQPKPSKPLSRSSMIGLLSAVSLSRVSKSGQIEGYRLTPKRADVDLASVGLQKGDIITHIGGTDLRGTKTNIAGVAMGFAQAKSVDVQLIRQGRAMTVTIRGNQ